MIQGSAYIFGEWQSDFWIDRYNIQKIVIKAKECINNSLSVEMKTRLEMLENIRKFWGYGGRFREEFLNLKQESNLKLSREMIELGLNELVKHLDKGTALRRICVQLNDSMVLDRMTKINGVNLQAVPLGVVLHIVSGNVFFGPAESLLAGLITKNVNIVKCPNGLERFLSIFIQSIEEAAPEIARTIALIPWQGGNSEIEKSFAQSVNGIIVAAGPDTISAYRQFTPPATALIEFGPRVSLAIITNNGFRNLDYERLALDVALWDQHACTAAQCIYVQGKENSLTVAVNLSDALCRLEAKLPQGDIPIDDKVEIAKLRDISRFKALSDTTRIFMQKDTGMSMSTVIYEEEPEFVSSPLHRTIRVKPYTDVNDFNDILMPIKNLLQSVGLLASSKERHIYESMLISQGALRICNIGSMNTPGADWLHDGEMDLQRLIRWVEVEGHE